MNDFRELDPAEMSATAGGHATPTWAFNPIGAFIWSIVHFLIHLVEDFGEDHHHFDGFNAGATFEFGIF